GLSSPYAQALPEFHPYLIGLSICEMPEPVSESQKWPSIKVGTHLPDEPKKTRMVRALIVNEICVQITSGLDYACLRRGLLPLTTKAASPNPLRRFLR
ncbi:MAG: hypothetical protein P9L94_08695, partial [Candidatus Hinthialibacter antarcticus]|nr:hypothetical protein [Candidatus Hinthialibacter antarcticus]